MLFFVGTYHRGNRSELQPSILVQALGRSHPGNPGVGRSLALPRRGCLALPLGAIVLAQKRTRKPQARRLAVLFHPW